MTPSYFKGYFALTYNVYKRYSICYANYKVKTMGLDTSVNCIDVAIL